MYARTYWVDHVTDQQGEIVQQGTLLDQAHFNNLEEGVSDLDLANAIRGFQAIQEGFNTAAELKTVTLAQTANPWPFNNSATTVALDQLRETTDYSVEVIVLAYSGRLGHIEVMDRACNGFKLKHDGSATGVQVLVRVTGGMTD